MNPTTHRLRSGPSGHTLLEMLLSLVLLSIVMASVGSAVMFASQAVPDDTSPVGSMLADHSVLSRIAEDLAVAQVVIEQTDRSVTVVVPDRTGDDLPDRVRYAWSGLRGEPLFYQLNESNAVPLIDSVDVFSLSYVTYSETKTLPGALQRSGSEKQLVAQEALFASRYGVGMTTVMGQRFTPSLSAEVLAYEPTRVTIYSNNSGLKDSVVPITIRDVDGYEPTGATYASGTILEAELSDSPGWNEIAFDQSHWVPVNEQKVLVMQQSSGTDGWGELFYKSGSTPFTISYNSGATWSQGWSGALLFRLYGYEIKQGNDFIVSQDHLSAINVTLQSVAPDRSPLTRRVRMLLAPQQVDAFAFTDFKTAPTPMDLNADGVLDWAHGSGGVPDSALVDGQWTPTADLIYESNTLSTASVIHLSARMQSNDTLGPLIEGPYVVDSAGDVLPISAMLRSNGTGGQELVIYSDLARTTEKAVIADLPTGWVDVALTVLPDEDVVSVEIDQVAIGSVMLERVADPGGIGKTVQFGSGGGVANFRDVRVEVGGTYSVSNTTTGGLGGLLNLLGF